MTVARDVVEDEAEALFERVDWAVTPVGPRVDWPQSLRTALSIMISSRFPMVVMWGRELVLFYNSGYIPVLGEKHPWAMGKPMREVWPEIWDTIGPMLHGVLETGRATYNDDLLLPLFRNGYLEECYFTFSYSPISDESGIGGVFCAVNETSARVVAERRLKTLHDLESRALESKTVEDACTLAAQTLANNGIDLPYSRIYLVSGSGRHLTAWTGARVDESENWAHSAVLDTGAAAVVESPVSATQFPVVPVMPAGVPEQALLLPLVSGSSAKPFGLFVAGISPHNALEGDYRAFLQLVAAQLAGAVSSARAYEEERARAQALADLDRAKTAFFSNVSHEFRTPLTLLLGPLETLLRKQDHSLDVHRPDLETAWRNALRLLKLVNTLLEFSRIEAGRAQARFQPLDISAYTCDLASGFRSLIESAGLRLRLDCPPLAEPVFVDPSMWEKIVLNLLSNAFKFTFEGEISVTVHELPYGVQVTVTDSGVGIASEDLPSIFERFRRIRSTRSRSHEGSGIGLALVHELVNMHGGTIHVESEAGRGTSFVITLRKGTAHLDRRFVGDAQPEHSSSSLLQYLEEASSWIGAQSVPSDTVDRPSARSSQRVLVVDDNADLRAYLTRLLGDRWHVETAEDGVQALEAIERNAPDIVVADVMMPHMDGLELLGRIRENARIARTPVILLSARAGEESAIEGLAAGADDYLVKPFTAEEIRARVGAHLRTAALREEALNALRDIAEERKRSERRTAFLAYASEVLGGSLDPAETLKNIAELCVPALADWCQIDVLADGGHVRTEIVRHKDPQKQRVLEQLIGREQISLEPDVGLSLVLKSGKSQLFERVPHELVEQVVPNSDDLALYDEVGYESALIVPFVARDKILGALSLVHGKTGRYTADDQLIAEELGRRGGAALYNSQSYEREHYVASALQRALLPDTVPQVSGASLDWAYRTAQDRAQVGGDWYDGFVLPDGSLFISMGDVSGHGFEAAVEMGSIRNIVRTLAFECEGPADVLKRAHNLLMANTSERFATAVVARFDPRTLHFEYACAGHQPPVLLMADGAHVLAGGGIPLGAPLENVTFQSHHVPLDHGAVVCLYTDGLVEYRRDIVAAEKRFLRLLTDTFSREVKAQAIIDSMLDGAPQSDDVALLLLRVEGPPVEDVRLALPAVPESAPIVRQYVRRFAQTHRLNAETTFRLLYVAGEAVANAVEHAHDPSTDSLQVLLSREGDEISLAVADRGRWKARPSEHRGRGLPLMRELCDSLEIEKGEHGIRVLARLTTVS